MEITASRDYDCLYFTPSTTGMYAFYSMSSSDPFGRIMSADYVDLATDDNSGSGDNFRVECQLTAGTTYILKSEFNGIETGKFDVIVTKIVAAQGISITQGATISGAVGYSQQLACYQRYQCADYAGNAQENLRMNNLQTVAYKCRHNATEHPSARYSTNEQ